MEGLRLDLPIDLVLRMAERAAASPITIPKPDEKGLPSLPPVLWERHVRVEWGVARQPDVEGPGPGGYRDVIGEIVYANQFELFYPRELKRYMEFESSIERDGASNTATLTVWNISEPTLARYYEALRQAGVQPDMEAGEPGMGESDLDAFSEERELAAGYIPYVRVYAGWGDWVPLIFTGKVKTLPETSWDRADKVTKFQLSDDEYSILPRWRCPGRDGGEFLPGTMKSEIVSRLAEELRLPLGRAIELGVDFPIKSGQSLSADKTVRDQLVVEAQHTNSMFYVLNSRLYFVPISHGYMTDLVLSKDSGLVWASRPIHHPQWGGTEEIVFTAMLNPMLNLDSVVRVIDHSFEGDVRISAVNIKIARQEYYCVCRGEIYDPQKADSNREAGLQALLSALNAQRRGVNPLVRVPGEFRLVEQKPAAITILKPRPVLPTIPSWIWDSIDGQWRIPPVQ